jgi:chemotaxis protein methyltransferase CheR
LSQTASAPAGENFSQRNFDRLSKLIDQYSGIKMPAGKRTMLTVRLRNRLLALDLASVDEYCSYVFEQGGAESELVYLIDAVSTNKTDFFRESAHFDFLRETMLPALAAAGQRQVKCWSAAASIGAEAYTLAMVLDDFRQRNRGPDYAILATDISTEVLAVAVQGQFPASMMDPVPPEFCARYVMKSRNPGSDTVRIVPSLRAKITWARLNLMDERYQADPDMDVIFCRNVLIYFDKTKQGQVLSRLCRHLKEGGYLILGHAETGAGAGLPVRGVVNSIYQKV